MSPAASVEGYGWRKVKLFERFPSIQLVGCQLGASGRANLCRYVPVANSTAAAGAFAESKFRQRRRAWRRRIWWAFPLVAACEIAIGLGFTFALRPPHVAFYVGFTFGVTVGMLFALADSPPHHVERWRTGADGEKATAKALEKLPREWQVVHDLDIGRGNVDHMVVGPSGIFLLDTKRLSGDVSVKKGVLTVRYREDPDDGYELPRLASRMRWLARSAETRLRGAGVGHLGVQPVVVIWAPFDQGSILDGDVAWVSGKKIAAVLRQRPTRLSADAVEQIAAVLRQPWRSAG